MVIDFIDRGTKGRLPREKTLTLDKAIDIAHSNELTSKQLEPMKSDTTSLLKDKSSLLFVESIEVKISFYPRDEAIPRLELMAALTLANLIKTVSEALIFTIKIDAVFNWISSQIVWCWIQGDSRCFKPFVQNRVQKIRRLWVKELCRYFHTHFNPSDIASRGANYF